MIDTITLQMGQRGVMTFPKSWRENYRFNPGDQFTLLDNEQLHNPTPFEVGTPGSCLARYRDKLSSP